MTRVNAFVIFVANFLKFCNKNGALSISKVKDKFKNTAKSEFWYKPTKNNRYLIDDLCDLWYDLHES